MKKIKHKLYNQKGASILLALMLFFVCFMVSSVILSSAAANADKLREREEIQREYLAVSSAATLLRDVIGGVTYEGWESNTIYGCVGVVSNIRPKSHKDEAKLCTEMTYEKGLDAGIREDVATMVYKAFTSNTKYVNQSLMEEVLYTELEITGDGMKTVKVIMALNTKTYNLTCTLTPKDRTDDRNAVTVVFNSAVTSPEKESAEKTVNNNGDKIHEVYIDIKNDDGTTKWDWIPKSYDITVYTLKTTVGYNRGTINKGVLS